ncbi:hypothetical protein PQX77_014149 [Marasmius sp. AFHP31]|nr:hypothetical protein PQX77_014149 [Marasmius sp. AFHP31]
MAGVIPLAEHRTLESKIGDFNLPRRSNIEGLVSRQQSEDEGGESVVVVIEVNPPEGEAEENEAVVSIDISGSTQGSEDEVAPVEVTINVTQPEEEGADNEAVVNIDISGSTQGSEDEVAPTEVTIEIVLPEEKVEGNEA